MKRQMLGILVVLALLTVPLAPMAIADTTQDACDDLKAVADDYANRGWSGFRDRGQMLQQSHAVLCGTDTSISEVEACRYIDNMVNWLLSKSFEDAQADGQTLQGVYDVLCAEPSTTTTSSTITTLASTTTTVADTTTSSDSTTTTTEPTTTTTVADTTTTVADTTTTVADTTTTTVADTTTTTTEPTTTTTVASTTTTTAPPAGYGCTRMIGMSQGKQSFDGFMAYIGETQSEWEGQFEAGALQWKWTNPDYSGWSERVMSSCGTLTRVVFFFDPVQSDTKGSGFEQDLHTVIGHIRDKHPSVAQIDLILLIGSEDASGAHQLCPSPVEGSPPYVRSTETHQLHVDGSSDAGIEAGWVNAVADSYSDVSVGPELHLDCSGFYDYVGHITDTAKLAVGQQLAEWYGY